MGKAGKVLLVYYVFLGFSSLIFSMLGWHSVYYNYAGYRAEFNPVLIPIIIGGLVALKLTIPPQSFKLFVVVYAVLWIIWFIPLYFGDRMNEVNIFGKPYRLNLIFYNYYRNVSRLDTHLPFVLYWFINYLFTIVIKQQEKKEETTKEGAK